MPRNHSVMWWFLRTAVAFVLTFDFAFSAAAQNHKTLIVRDSIGLPIAFATVNVKAGSTRLTDATGKVDLGDVKDSVQVSVRRIGYREFFGKLYPSSGNGMYEVNLHALPQMLGTVAVSASRAAGPLERRGYYERMLDAQKGRYNGEYYTPETLESSNVGKVSQLLNNSRHARLDFYSGLPVLRGRNRCTMSIFVDGQLMKGVYDGPPRQGESRSMPWESNRQIGRGDKLTIDDLINPGDIAAIEIYPHAGNAPSLFQMTPDKGSCGVVAIWTGGR